MKKNSALLLVSLLFAGQVFSQTIDEIIQLIKNTSKKDLVSVVGRYEVSEQVIRAENLVFHDKSELVFTNYDYPYVVIAVKNLKFNAPQIKSIVKFGNFDILKLKGTSGGNGSNGASGTGDGGNGKHGTDGGTGGNGYSKKTPDIYFFVENINTDFGDISSFDWQIIGNGLQGGEGGTGGIGGNGGGGNKGRKASDGFGTCRRGGQKGGNGGNGGRGGNGGEGGDGGKGANIFLVGKKLVTDRLTYAQFILDGGGQGVGGPSGKSGQGGGGGNGGNGSKFCSGGDKGGNGATPPPLGHGTNGNSGIKGEVKIIEENISNLF